MLGPQIEASSNCCIPNAPCGGCSIEAALWLSLREIQWICRVAPIGKQYIKKAPELSPTQMEWPRLWFLQCMGGILVFPTRSCLARPLNYSAQGTAWVSKLAQIWKLQVAGVVTAKGKEKAGVKAVQHRQLFATEPGSFPLGDS